jgi:hypothetical protein
VSETRAFAAGLAGGVLLGPGVVHRAGPLRAPGGVVDRRSGRRRVGTDFLNAAYYRRDPAEREVDDLRLAFVIVTTHWSHKDRRRLHLADVTPFHRCFGRLRLTAGARSPRGTLNREQLLEGAAHMFGDWFPDAYRDGARRGWGIVEVSSGERVIDALTRVEAWPDYASETGRFTALRDSHLDGQMFEIEVAAGTAAGVPVFQRGYVTVTRLVGRDDPEALRAYFEELEDGLVRFSDHGERATPEDGTPIFGMDLTTHRGHFMAGDETA